MIYNADRNRGGKHLSFLVAAISVFSAIAGSAQAEDPVVDEIDRVTTVNRALLDVCSARLAREQWKLEKLDLLRNRGHASWREVARQQVAVKTLEAHRHAADQFAGYLGVLRRRVEQVADQQGDRRPAKPAADFTTPIKLSLPGSVRLIAWFEANQMPAEVAAENEMALDRPALATDQSPSELDAARQKVADAEARVRGLTPIADKPGIANELERAKLDLAVATAEFDWHEAQWQWQQSQSERGTLRQQTLSANHQTDQDERAADAGATLVAISAIAANVSFVSHNSNADLHDATLRVAAAEAEAVGELRAAEIALKRKQLRREAMLQLLAKGFASQRELDHTRDDVSMAESLVEELTARGLHLAQSYEKLRAGIDGHRSHADDHHLASSSDKLPDRASDSTSDQIQPESLPEVFLDHVCAVEHLIDLRQRRFATFAHRDATTAELEMLQELHRKLEQMGVGGESIRRELDNLQLDIEYHQARALAATERLTALGLEEARFVRQFLEQLQATTNDARDTDMPPFQTIRVAEIDTAKPNGDLQFVALAAPTRRVAGGWPRLSYLESPATVEDLSLCDLVQLTFGIPAFSVWDSPYRSRRGRSAVSANQRIDGSDFGPQLFSRYARQRVCDDTLLDGPTLFSVNDLWRNRLRFHSPSYYDYYAFGKRRSDRRPPRARYWSYGTPPWYLPGYPTNYR